MRVDDICGRRRRVEGIRQTPGNPLNPVYNLQSYTLVEPLVPKFIRDSIRIDDIEGTHAIPSLHMRVKKMPPFEEIEGSTYKQKK